MAFCTVVNCMDGRVQVPVNRFLQARFGAEYVDTITEPGPVAILGDGASPELRASIERRLDVSVHKHGSVGAAVVGHADCTGNPAGEDAQRGQIAASVAAVRARYPALPVIGLWVDALWRVHEIEPAPPAPDSRA
jgi:hypothetical protein